MKPRRLRHSYRALIALLGVLALLAAACGTAETDDPEVVEAPEPEPEPVDEPEDVTPAEGEPYRIGMIAALSGGASSLGIPEGNTARMLEEQINAAGGIEGPDGLMHPLEIIVLDTQSEETETLLATRQLIERDQVPVIVGPSQSGTTMAIVDTIQEAQIPLISMAAAAAIIEPVEEREWVFKTPQTDRLVLEVLVDYYADQGYENVAWMSVDTGFGDTGRAEWLPLAEHHGFEVVADERFSSGDTDMTAQLTRVGQTDADAILVWAIPPEAAVLTRNHAELAVDIPLYQSHGVGNRAFIDISEGAAEGVRFPAGKLLVAEHLPDDDPQKPVLLQYIDDYVSMFDEEPSTFGGHGWDGVMMAVEALGACGEDPACIRDHLETDIRDFVGITGVFNMSPDDHMGLTPDALVMIEIQDDDWILVQ
jgi:branched-chain amino acid transport system substrate-binding protein